MGIEPTYSAWEADVLPLNYTRRLLGFQRFYSLTEQRVTVGWQRNGATVHPPTCDFLKCTGTIYRHQLSAGK